MVSIMKNIYHQLNLLPLYQSALIRSLPENPDLRKRLMDLGMTKNTRITPVLSSPSGDPRAYLFRGIMISVRNSDAQHIILQME